MESKTVIAGFCPKVQKRQVLELFYDELEIPNDEINYNGILY